MRCVVRRGVGEAKEIHSDGMRRRRRQYAKKDTPKAMCRNGTEERQA